MVKRKNALKVTKNKIDKSFTIFRDAVKKRNTGKRIMKKKEIILRKDERRMVYSMRTTTSQFAKRPYEQKAKDAKKLLEEKMGKMHSHAETTNYEQSPLS